MKITDTIIEELLRNAFEILQHDTDNSDNRKEHDWAYQTLKKRFETILISDKLTVEDLKKALNAGAKNANELHRSLKAQFGMTNINPNRRLK